MPEKFVVKKEGELNPEQMQIVTEGDGPCLVLAGAGSGKTRTIVYRVAYLLSRGVPANQILILTFTNKAARQMMDRIELLLKSPRSGPMTRPLGLLGGTYHSVANRILRQYAKFAGYEPNFSILDEDDACDIIKLAVKDCGIDQTARRFPSPAVLRDIVSFGRNARLDLGEVLEQKYLRFAPLCDEIRRVSETYKDLKRKANAMDFDDLLHVFLNLLRTNTEIASHLGRQFRHILVDEYQDTNSVQAEIVRRLGVVHKNILVVGDDAQSIYSFRAASVKNILEFPKLFPDTKIFRLETNYRSTPEILDVANDIIRNNEERFEKNLRPVKQNFAKPRLVPCSDAHEEASFIAETVLRLRDEGAELREIAVLFRAAHHSHVLEMELAKRDIPYEYRGGVKFFERAHIKDVLAALRVRVNSKDAVAWLRFLSLGQGIGTATAGRLTDVFGAAPDFASALTLDVSGIVPKRGELGWRAIHKTLSDTSGIQNPGDGIRAIAGSEFYSDYLSAEYPDWQERREDLEQLAVFADDFKSASDFLGEVSLYDDYGAARREGASYDDERMVLSTIHQAKGLEWDAVFLMNLTADSFPNRRALLEDGGLEEERRLFYVAVTRARRELFLTYPLTIGYDSLAFQRASPFISEINPRLLEPVEIELRRDEPVIDIDI